MKRFASLSLALALVLALFAGCGKTANSTAAYDMAAPKDDFFYETAESVAVNTSAYDMAMPAEMPQKATMKAESAAYEPEVSVEEESALGGTEIDHSAKIIYTANIEMQTTEFDAATQGIAALVDQVGGYFEHKDVSDYSSSYRYASYTVRVPAEKFEAFCSQLGGLCHVVYASQNANNVTEAYYDVQSRLETAQIKLDRLQELLTQAKDMYDIITLESAISETEYNIESLSGRLRHYDAQVDYSTVSIGLNEVYQLSETEKAPLTFTERIKNAFTGGIDAAKRFLENSVVWFAYNWLGVLVWAVILVGAALIVRGCVRHRRRRRESAASVTPAAPAEEPKANE